MLVDDELPLLQLVERYLTRLGFEVEPHSTSQNALRNFEAAPARYDLVIADLGMPDVPGDALLTSMLQRRPQLVALICSGSEFFPSTLPAGVRDRVGFLQKPFVPKMLAEAIERLLAQRK